MTYSSKIKNEILSVELEKEEEIVAEIFGILLAKNSIGENRIYFATENEELASRLYLNLKKLNIEKLKIEVINDKMFEIVWEKNSENEKEFSDFLARLKKIYEKKEMDKNVIRGFFLASAYIKSPEKGYSIDFFLEDEKSTEYLHDILKKNGKRVFMGEKGNNFVVYLRNSEDILDIIFMMGGINSFFEFEEITINKEIRNKINRTINWEIANEAKKITTAEKQIGMIQKIDEEIGLDNITGALREAAEIRLKNEEASLQELADMIGVTKSGIRNRFRRLEEIYNSIE